MGYGAKVGGGAVKFPGLQMGMGRAPQTKIDQRTHLASFLKLSLGRAHLSHPGNKVMPGFG